jgi:hypothetical protein
MLRIWDCRIVFLEAILIQFPCNAVTAFAWKSIVFSNQTQTNVLRTSNIWKLDTDSLWIVLRKKCVGKQFKVAQRFKKIKNFIRNCYQLL